MNQLRFRLFVLVLSLFFSQAALSQNKKLDKAQKKILAAYNAGSYPKALKALKKFQSGALKLGETNYLVDGYLWEARLNVASGLLPEFEIAVDNTLKTSEKVFGVASKSYASNLIDIAELYNEYGNYRKSREYLDKSNSILEKAGLMDEEVKARLYLVKAEAMIGQGFCKGAIATLRDVEDYFAKRAVEKETVVDGATIKAQRVPYEELPKRFGDYARLLTLMARAYGKMGNTTTSDSVYLITTSVLKKGLRFMGETSIAGVTAHYLQATTLLENGTELVDELKLDNILNELKKRTAATQLIGHDIYLTYLTQLLDDDNIARYNNIKLEYQKLLKKYFPSGSVHFANLNAIEFSKRKHSDKTKNLEGLALGMLNSQAVPKNYRTTERILTFLTEVALTNKSYTNAEGYFSQIVEIAKELYGDTSPEYHIARIKLASFYLDYTNNIEKAGKIFDESYTKSLSGEIFKWHKDHIFILNHLAKYYEVTDLYALASTTLEKASDLAKGKYRPTDGAYAIEEDYLAQLMLKIGEYDKAESALLIALKILEDKRKEDEYLGAYIHAVETQATLFGIKGLFDEAEENLERTRKLIKKADIVLNELSSAQELSSLLIQLGRYSDATEILELQIEEYEKLYGKQTLRLIEPLVNQGKILLAKGDYTEAERTATRANSLAVKTYGDNSTKTAPTQKLLAEIYYTLGDYDKAEANVSKAIASQEKQFTRQHIEVAKSLAQLALIKFYKGDNKQQIEKLMLEAQKIIKDKLGDKNPQYADILKNVAVLYISEGKYDIAFNSLTVAESIWREKNGRKNNINLASIYTLTGDVYYQLKNYGKAEEFYNRSKDLYEKFFSTRHPEYVKVLSKLSKVYYMQKDFKRSKRMIEESLNNYEGFIKQYFPALSEREKAKYWNTIKGDFEFYNTLAFSNLEDFRDLTGKVYNYQLLTKALLLSSSIKIRERILGSNDEELKTRYNEWINNKELLTMALSMSADQLLENGINTEALLQDVERIEKELSQKSEIFGDVFENKRIVFDDVRKSLKANEVAMEMVRYRHFNHTFTDSVIYAALYLKPETSKPKAIILKDGHKMESRYFKFYRNAITGRIPDNISYNVYWKQINDEIGQVATIYLSADGIYNQLNLESISTPDGRYVIDNSNIVLVSNTKDIYLKKVKTSTVSSKEKTASMFGNPKFYLASAQSSQTITALPGTEREVDQLQFLLKEKGWVTSEYVEDAAAEEKIKEMNSPKIFHIATHGLYRPSTQMTLESEIEGNEALMTQNPLMRTGLLLKGAGDLLDKTSYNYNMENGILTAYEAMSLNLDKTDLVVLSACETGLGDLEAGEGVYGLQRAFLVAGAKVLIMSMFKVDDEATQKLMLKFYQKWLTTGNLRQSFIEAKKELRVDYPDPIHWGAFMMIGLE
jgi:CHAT domain-containing protein